MSLLTIRYFAAVKVILLFNPNNVADLHGLQRAQSSRNERLQTHIAVSLRSKNQNGDIQTGKVLLIRKVTVDGDQNFVSTGGSFQEVAILQSFVSRIFDGVHFMASEIALKMARYALVKQQLHFPAAFPLRVPEFH